MLLLTQKLEKLTQRAIKPLYPRHRAQYYTMASSTATSRPLSSRTLCTAMCVPWTVPNSSVLAFRLVQTRFIARLPASNRPTFTVSFSHLPPKSWSDESRSLSCGFQFSAPSRPVRSFSATGMPTRSCASKVEERPIVSRTGPKCSRYFGLCRLPQSSSSLQSCAWCLDLPSNLTNCSPPSERSLRALGACHWPYQYPESIVCT